jgi:hypothetical protein
MTRMWMGIRRKRVAWLVAGALVFAQAVAVAQACAAPDASPAMAFAETGAEHDCDGAAADPVPNPNACLENCNSGDQATGQTLTTVGACPPPAAMLLVALPAPVTPTAAEVRTSALHPSDPPPSLRFCSYQL